MKTLNKRCECGHNCIPLSDKRDFIGNLYQCKSCGFILMGDLEPQFVLTDLRELEIKWTMGFREVTHKIYQLDLLKLIKMAELCNNHNYSDRLKHFIKCIDELSGLKTDFNRKLPKTNLRDILG